MSCKFSSLDGSDRWKIKICWLTNLRNPCSTFSHFLLDMLFLKQTLGSNTYLIYDAIKQKKMAHVYTEQFLTQVHTGSVTVTTPYLSPRLLRNPTLSFLKTKKDHPDRVPSELLLWRTSSRTQLLFSYTPQVCEGTWQQHLH